MKKTNLFNSESLAMEEGFLILWLTLNIHLLEVEWDL